MESRFIKLDKESIIPLYKQLYLYFVEEIKSGRLTEGDKLPSRRVLKDNIGISKTTIDRAYQLLIDEGYVLSKSRAGFYVRSRGTYDLWYEEERWESEVSKKYTLSSNGIDLSEFPHRSLIKISDEILENQSLFGHGEKQGEIVLRKAISNYLRLHSDIACIPMQIFIGAGVDYLLGKLYKVVGYDKKIGFENPLYRIALDAINRDNENINYFNINEDGLNVSELYASDTNVMYVMPNHHYPTGYKMTVEKRKALLEWANESEDRYIIEDSFDSDFQYEERLPSIYSLDKNEKVIYMGAFNQNIADSIKIAYMILPRSLVKLWREKLPLHMSLVNRFEQYIIAEYIEKGHHFRRIRALNKTYNEKRELLIRKFMSSEISDRIKIWGGECGSYFLLKIESSHSERLLYEQALKNGVKVIPVSLFRMRPSDFPDGKTFIIGYGETSKAGLEESVDILCRVWKNLP